MGDGGLEAWWEAWSEVGGLVKMYGDVLQMVENKSSAPVGVAFLVGFLKTDAPKRLQKSRANGTCL